MTHPSEAEIANALEGHFYRVPQTERPAPRAWKKDDRAKLIELYQSGLTYDAIADTMERRRSTISGKLRELIYVGVLVGRRS